MSRIVLQVPMKLPYKNELLPSPGRHAWLRFRSVKNKWAKWIRTAPPGDRARGPRVLLITRVMGPRERRFDTANVYYAAAAILDLIVQAGYLVNDSDVACLLERPVQRRAYAGEVFPSVLIELNDIEEAAPRAVPS